MPVWMQGMSEDFEAVYESRARAREVGVAIGDVDTAVADTWQVTPSGLLLKNGQVLQCAVGRKAAAGDEEYFRRCIKDGLPENGARWPVRIVEHVDAACHFD